MKKEELYQKFIDVSTKINELTEQKRVLSKMVTDKLNQEKIDKVESDVGMITRTSRITWRYSDGLRNQITGLQKTAQENGTAKKTETKYLRVSLKKI